MWDFVFSQRKRALLGEQTFEESQVNIQDLYKQYREVYENPSTKKIWDGESMAHWHSFFAPIVESLVKVDIPIYVAIGSEDTSVPIESADIIPLEFIRLRKTNLTYRVLPGVDHSLGGRTDNSTCWTSCSHGPIAKNLKDRARILACCCLLAASVADCRNILITLPDAEKDTPYFLPFASRMLK